MRQSGDRHPHGNLHSDQELIHQASQARAERALVGAAAAACASVLLAVIAVLAAVAVPEPVKKPKPQPTWQTGNGQHYLDPNAPHPFLNAAPSKR